MSKASPTFFFNLPVPLPTPFPPKKVENICFTAFYLTFIFSNFLFSKHHGNVLQKVIWFHATLRPSCQHVRVVRVTDGELVRPSLPQEQTGKARYFLQESQVFICVDVLLLFSGNIFQGCLL